MVRATRIFTRADDSNPTSPFSAVAIASTIAVQDAPVPEVPPATTTDTSATFSWSITNNAAGDLPWCALDFDPQSQSSAGEVPCATTGVTLTGLAVGTHTLTVYPYYGEQGSTYTWTVTAPAAPACPPPRSPPPS